MCLYELVSVILTQQIRYSQVDDETMSYVAHSSERQHNDQDEYVADNRTNKQRNVNTDQSCRSGLVNLQHPWPEVLQHSTHYQRVGLAGDIFRIESDVIVLLRHRCRQHNGVGDHCRRHRHQFTMEPSVTQWQSFQDCLNDGALPEVCESWSSDDETIEGGPAELLLPASVYCILTTRSKDSRPNNMSTVPVDNRNRPASVRSNRCLSLRCACRLNQQ